MSDWKKWMARSDAYAAELSSIPHTHYDIDPFVDVYPDQEVQGVYHLYFPTTQKGASAWMHLIVGEEKALLVDTGFGVGDLAGLVRQLTDKPLMVFNTHFHGDHSQGNGQFDQVYIHRFDVPYLEMSMKNNKGGFLPQTARPIRPEDIVPVGHPEIIPVEDGDLFDLGGGRKLEVIHMPGHAAGGAMLLDHENGLLFSGDAVVYTPTLIIGSFPCPWYGEQMTVQAFRDALEKAMPRLSGVRRLYTGHSVQGIGPQQLTDMLACCDAILTHPEEHELYDYVDNPAQRQIMCKGGAMIVYSDDRIRHE